MYTLRDQKHLLRNTNTIANRSCDLNPSFALLSGLIIAIVILASPMAQAIPLSHSAQNSKTVTLASSESVSTPTDIAHLTQSSRPVAGDTAYVLCPLHEIQFAPFGGSDCWGYTSDGSDFAIMGINDGIVFVDATSGSILDTIPGPKNGCGSVYWRDMATMGNYCYAVSECSGTNDGIIVIDMSFLPDSAHYVGSFEVAPARVTSHNLSIDSISGFLYVEGFGASGSNVFVHSLTDPAAPAYVTGLGDMGGEIHDMYAKNDTIYIAEGSVSSYSIWEVSDKFNPVMLSRWTTPSGGYAHNIWPTEDQSHVVTTEETVNRTVKIWDVTDYANVQLASQYLAPSDLAHNAQVRGDLLFISHYESGIRVLDLADPANPVEIAGFDTYSSETGDFNGSWGVYNFSPNGFVYGSNVDGRLFILQEGEMIINDSMSVDSATASPGDLVRVDISATHGLDARQFLVPVSWANFGDVDYSHFSTTGLRTEYFEVVDQVNTNPFTDEATFRLLTSFNGSSPELAAGSGPILSLYFTVNGGAPDQFNPVELKQIGGSKPSITTTCAIVTEPTLLSGGIAIVQGCCDLAGDADHSGTVTIGDVTFLIGRIFSSGPAPFCGDEADANGSSNISIGDVTHLIAHIFSGGLDPVCGETGQ